MRGSHSYCFVEDLETRRQFAALLINGSQTNTFLQTTSSADAFTISQSSGVLAVTKGSTTKTYPGFNGVSADLGGGADTFTINASVTYPSTVLGANGNDTLR